MTHRPLVALVFALALPAASAQNQAAVFVNGVQGSVDVPYSAQLMAPTTGLTVESWVRYTEVAAGTLNKFPTIARARPLPGWSWFLRVNAGTTSARILRFAVTTQAGQINADWSFAAGELSCWTHVAAVYDGFGTSRLYVNGVQVAQTTNPSATTIINSGPSTIGLGEGLKNATLHNEVWNGVIDRLRIWSVPQTQAAIRASMFSTLAPVPGLEGQWLFDGNLLDSSGNGNHGMLFGGVGFQAATLPPTFEFQTNSSAATLAIATAVVRPFCAATATATLNQTLNLTLSSTLAGNPFDVVLTVPEVLVPASAGGFTTAGGQVLNVNLLAPSLLFLFGGPSPFSVPFPGPQAIPFSAPVPLTGAVQMAIIDPAAADGFTLSAGGQFSIL